MGWTIRAGWAWGLPIGFGISDWLLVKWRSCKVETRAPFHVDCDCWLIHLHLTFSCSPACSLVRVIGEDLGLGRGLCLFFSHRGLAHSQLALILALIALFHWLTLNLLLARFTRRKRIRERGQSVSKWATRPLCRERFESESNLMVIFTLIVIVHIFIFTSPSPVSRLVRVPVWFEPELSMG